MSGVGCRMLLVLDCPSVGCRFLAVDCSVTVANGGGGGVGGLQIDVVYLPDQQRPCIWAQMRGELRGLSQWVLLNTGAKIYFGDLTPYIKGQCHEIFCFWFFSWISFPQASDYTVRAVSIFFENSLRYAQLKVCHGGKWKTFKQKNFNNIVWTPLGTRVNIYIHFCLQVHFTVPAAWYCCHYCPFNLWLPLSCSIAVADHTSGNGYFSHWC